MANSIRIKRRAASGGAGSPTSLLNAELAYNEFSNILYYGFGDDGGGNATSVIAIAGSGSSVDLGSTQTISGDKTFSGSVDLTGAFNIDGVEVTASAAELNHSVGVTSGIQGQLDAITADIGENRSAIGISDGDINLGTFGGSGATLTDGITVKAALEELEAAIEADILHTKISDFDAGVQANTLDSLANPVADVELNNQKITGLADPVGAQDAATKAYVDATANGLDVKASVRVATTASITLSGTQTIDGVVLVAGDRVLVKDQSTGSENGIYEVASGSWARSSDADNAPGSEVTSGMFTFVEEGSASASAGFVLQTANPITLDTTSLSFVQFSGAGQVVAGNGMTKTGTQLDVNTANTGRIVVNSSDIDLATHGTAGTYNGLTVDAYGRVSSFAQPTTLAGYSIADAQPLDAGLTSISGLTTAADQMLYLTGADTYATTSLSVYSRSLLDDADAATARGTLGLGTIATQNANSVAITGGSIDNITMDCGTY